MNRARRQAAATAMQVLTRPRWNWASVAIWAYIGWSVLLWVTGFVCPRPFAATGVAASAVVAAGFIVGEPIRNLARPGNRILIDGRSTHHAALTVRADQTLRGGGRSGWLLEDCGPPTSAAESGCLPRSGH